MHRPPQLWEAGCESDPVRNLFAIPFLKRVIRAFKPSTVLDVGCGTGYITRGLAHRSRNKSIRWRLLDNDPAMLDFARSQGNAVPGRFAYYLTNIEVEDPAGRPRPSQLVFIAYSLLDIVLTTNTARNVAALVARDGLLLIFLPDVLEDVFQAASHNYSLLEQYIHGHCSINKPDKFTATNVIFEANRLEKIIELFISARFHLLHLEKHTVREGHHHYCLILKKSAIQL